MKSLRLSAETFFCASLINFLLRSRRESWSSLLLDESHCARSTTEPTLGTTAFHVISRNIKLSLNYVSISFFPLVSVIFLGGLVFASKINYCRRFVSRGCCEITVRSASNSEKHKFELGFVQARRTHQVSWIKLLKRPITDVY